jgi:hypothetical protein
MDWSQQIIAVLIVSAGLTGRQWGIVAVFTANFLATMELARNPIDVAIADALAASVILFFWQREQISRAKVVAAIYATMIPIYPALTWAGFPSHTIYAIVDALAIAQLIVMGRWDVGIGRALRSIRGRLADFYRSRTQRPELAAHSSVSQANGERS